MIEVVIISQGRNAFFERALASVQAQNFPKSKYKWKLIKNFEKVDREKEVLNSDSEWIFFLDEDCHLPDPEFLSRFKTLAANHPSVHLWGGLYQNSLNSSYTEKAYNQLCNFWVLLSANDENLLGGCLALHVPTVKPLLTKNPISWGGEETFLLRSLQRNKLNCRLNQDLNVKHSPGPQSLQTVWQRGLVHGFNRIEFKLGTRKVAAKGLLFGFKNFFYWPFWLLHFSSVAMGSLSLKTVQASTKLQSSDKKLYARKTAFRLRN